MSACKHFDLKETTPEGFAKPTPYPHVTSCATCWRLKLCTYCGQPTTRRERCDKGRCKDCCDEHCRHPYGLGKQWN